MATYTCYGLTLNSETALPELSAADTNPHPDVEIVDGRLGDPPASASVLRHAMWRDATSFGVDVPDVARYRVDGGSTITIDRYPEADERDVRLYLLGTVMGALMIQRGHLVLHGNAVRVGEVSAVVVGHSGSGKSSLAAEFVRRGLDVLSDDVVPVDAEGRALAGYPRLKLWLDTLDVLGLSPNGLERLTPSVDKFNVPIDRAPLDPMPIRWIYVLEQHDDPQFELLPVRGVDSYQQLREHTYRRELIHDDDAALLHLRQCAALASSSQITRVVRPARSMTPAATADAILADIGAYAGVGGPDGKAQP